MNLNKEIARLIQNHGYNVREVEGYLVPEFEHEVLIDSQLTINENNEFVRSILAVLIHIGEERSIIECFGDVGNTKEQAINNNLFNFASGDLHVIMGAFNNIEEEDDFLLIETWSFNNRNWKVYIGNFIPKTSNKSEPTIPENLFKKIEDLIKEQNLTKNYHWIRMYCGHNNFEILQAEFLIDNEINIYAQEQIANLEWEKCGGFYSVRNFIILKQIIASP